MKKLITVFAIAILWMVSAVSAQTPFISPENFYQVIFPCEEARDTVNGSEKTHFCNQGMQFYQMTVNRFTEADITENGKELIRDLVEILVQSVPYDSFDTVQTDFHNYECMRFSSKGFINYETIVFNIYDRMFIMEIYSVNEEIDKEARDQYLNSFQVLENELEALKAADLENRQKKIENLKKRQSYGR